MTPQQQAALQALMARTLTAEEVTQIDALLPTGSVGAIAALLSVGRTRVASHFASERGILERFPLGPIAGDALLTKLDAFSATAHPMASIVRRALKFLGQPEGLDIGSAATQGMLDQLALGGVMTAEERAGLKAMATAPHPVAVADVETALKG